MQQKHRGNHRNSRCQCGPGQTWPGKAPLVSRGHPCPRDCPISFSLVRNRSGDDVRRGKCQSDHIAAVSTERQVLEDAVALGHRKPLLGKSRQQVGIRMHSLGYGSLQAVIHHFGHDFG